MVFRTFMMCSWFSFKAHTMPAWHSIEHQATKGSKWPWMAVLSVCVCVWKLFQSKSWSEVTRTQTETPLAEGPTRIHNASFTIEIAVFCCVVPAQRPSSKPDPCRTKAANFPQSQVVWNPPPIFEFFKSFDKNDLIFGILMSILAVPSLHNLVPKAVCLSRSHLRVDVTGVYSATSTVHSSSFWCHKSATGPVVWENMNHHKPILVFQSTLNLMTSPLGLSRTLKLVNPLVLMGANIKNLRCCWNR